MSRRLSAIRFAHRLRDLPDPTEAARVVAVWEGIRRLHGAPPEQAAPLMPPELFAVLDACPQTRSWKTKGRQSEPDLAGLRDRVLILVGFVGALRRSELVGLDLDRVAEHPNGLVITLPRSKTNQTGEQAELVVLPRGCDPRRCAVTALRNWTEAAGIEDGPLLRPRPGTRRSVRALHEHRAVVPKTGSARQRLRRCVADRPSWRQPRLLTTASAGKAQAGSEPTRPGEPGRGEER
jgi:integrase